MGFHARARVQRFFEPIPSSDIFILADLVSWIVQTVSKMSRHFFSRDNFFRLCVRRLFYKQIHCNFLRDLILENLYKVIRVIRTTCLLFERKFKTIVIYDSLIYRIIIDLDNGSY